MNKDQVKGRLKKVQGTVKEVAGKIVGDKSLEAEGKVEKKRRQDAVRLRRSQAGSQERLMNQLSIGDEHERRNQQKQRNPRPPHAERRHPHRRDVFNLEGHDLGDIKDVMREMRSGRIAYAVLSFGGFLGMGEKLFAIPWSALAPDAENKRFVLSVEKDRLVNALGFDKDYWPNMADESWIKEIHSDHGATPHPNDFPV